MENLALTIPGPNGPVKISAPGGIPTSGVYSWNFSSIVGVFFAVLITAAILLGLLYLVWGGYDWITSQGDKQKVDNARHKIYFAIVGLIIALSAYFMVNMIYGFFNLS